MISKTIRLAVIPSDPLRAYEQAGYESWLEEYFNPLHFFNEVYLLSPLEKEQKEKFGMKVIPVTSDRYQVLVRELDIDIVRAYGGYWACDMACKNKVKGIPVVVSVHDVNPDKLYNTIKKADVVFCVSEAVKKLVLTKFKKSDRVWILPNRVNFDIMYPYPEDKLEELNRKYPFKYSILHIGRKTEQKNLDTLIKSMEFLDDNYCLLAVGKENTDEYMKLVSEINVEDRCFFIESIKNEELARYYSWSSCMCVPSRWEGFGIVFIEALACESVVVTSDIPPMNEYIRHEENGLLVKDYENPRELAKMIKIACTDLELIKGIKTRARNSVRKFGKSIIDKLEVDYYAKIISMKNNGDFGKSLIKGLFNR